MFCNYSWPNNITSGPVIFKLAEPSTERAQLFQRHYYLSRNEGRDQKLLYNTEPKELK